MRLERDLAVATKGSRGTATRDQIVDVATRLMHRQGYHCTSLDDVLRESGVGKGNFYYYFRSKEDLGYAIIGRMEAFLESTLYPLLDQTSAEPIHRIHRFLDRILETQRELNCIGGCPIGNLASELSDVHEGFRRRLAEIFSEWRRRIADALALEQAAGRFSPGCEPGVIAQFLVASLEGAILLTKVTKDIGVMERCVAELKRHLTLYTGNQP